MTEIAQKILEVYSDSKGKEPFTNWLLSLERSVQIKIRQRLRRVELGNLGDYKILNDGLGEFRFHFNSGYRIYFGQVKNTVILLLCGGDKGSQKRDIEKAKKYWLDYKEVQQDEKI